MAQKDNELLELTVYEQSKDSLDQLIDVEIETFGQIMEELKEMPYVDKLIKFCKVGFGIMNMWQIRKIARFLKGSETISDEEKNKYLNSLNKKDKQRISGYLTNLLYVTEDEEKAEILGLIYAARVRNEISNEDMLRLSSNVNKVFFLTCNCSTIMCLLMSILVIQQITSILLDCWNNSVRQKRCQKRMVFMEWQ